MSVLQTFTHGEAVSKDDGKGAYIMFFGNNKTIARANELIDQWLSLGLKDLRVVNATDEIKELIKPFAQISFVGYYNSYDEAYDAIFSKE